MTQDTSSSISLNLKTKSRDRPFHDQYLYSVEFYVATAHLLRGMRQGSYRRSDIPEKYEKHKDSLKKSLRPPLGTVGGNWVQSKINAYDDEKCLESLLAAYDLISSIRDIKIVVSHQWVTIYSNTLSFVPKVQKYVSEHLHTARHAPSRVDEVIVTTAEIDRPRDSIRRKRSDYLHRIKLRHIQPKEFQFHGIKSFVETYLQHIRVSESLIQTLQRPHRTYISFESHYFIDINDRKLATLLEIAAPGTVDKVLQIIVDK